MKRVSRSALTRLPVILIALAMAGLAIVKVTFGPGNDFPNGIPAYARIESLVENGQLKGVLIHHNDDWAAIPFYRDPACVLRERPSRNLLDILHFPGDGDPGAYVCPLLVEGFAIWKHAPGVDPAPMQQETHEPKGRTVPVWFVPWKWLEPQVADGLLTMPELAALCPADLRGEAYFYQETLHPSEAVHHTKTTIVAHGTLNIGGRFDVESGETGNVLTHTTIHLPDSVRRYLGR